MEIIARWRERRDLESFVDAGRERSVAFKGFALVGWQSCARYAELSISAIAVRPLHAESKPELEEQP
jgi:hypothetical protein